MKNVEKRTLIPRKLAPNKVDINQKNYEKIVQELLKQVYYKK